MARNKNICTRTSLVDVCFSLCVNNENLDQYWEQSQAKQQD